jgi:hypothetical protein
MAQAVELLVPGGVLVLFGRPAELKDPHLFAAVDEIWQRVLPGDDPVRGRLRRPRQTASATSNSATCRASLWHLSRHMFNVSIGDQRNARP